MCIDIETKAIVMCPLACISLLVWKIKKGPVCKILASDPPPPKKKEKKLLLHFNSPWWFTPASCRLCLDDLLGSYGGAGWYGGGLLCWAGWYGGGLVCCVWVDAGVGLTKTSSLADTLLLREPPSTTGFWNSSHGKIMVGYIGKISGKKSWLQSKLSNP